MKVSLRKGYIELYVPMFLYWYSKLTGTGGRARAAAAFPFILTSKRLYDCSGEVQKTMINHELIHFEQQKEMLFIGMWVLHVIEFFRTLGKGMTSFEKYVFQSYEQEAYDNMHNLEYIETRRRFAHIRKYWNYKPITWEWVVSKFSDKDLAEE